MDWTNGLYIVGRPLHCRTSSTAAEMRCCYLQLYLDHYHLTEEQAAALFFYHFLFLMNFQDENKSDKWCIKLKLCQSGCILYIAYSSVLLNSIVIQKRLKKKKCKLHSKLTSKKQTADKAWLIKHFTSAHLIFCEKLHFHTANSVVMHVYCSRQENEAVFLIQRTWYMMGGAQTKQTRLPDCCSQLSHCWIALFVCLKYRF